jgi:polar amino acid transport system substrate-binding protein
MVRVISGVSGVLRFLSLATIVPAFIALAFIVPAPVGVLQPTPAQAQTCGSDYTIKEGETLAQIAARVYGNPAQWTIIFYANQDRLGTNVSLLVPGFTLRLPCVGGAQQSQPLPPIATTPAQTQTPSETAIFISSLVRRIEFLTADGFAPYTGRSLEGGGMLTQVIAAAMGVVKDEAKGGFDYGVSWVNDWSAHLNPLLLTRAFDVGFPWARPNCDAVNLEPTSQFRCQRFFFSEPLYEGITGLFVRANSRIKSLRSEEIAGTTLCLPAGQPVHELDDHGRSWVKDGKVVLMRPPTVDECFRMLDNGTVDGVVESELAGRASITSLALGDKVSMLDQPIALTTYHVLVSKSHPQARTILYYVNSSLEKLRASGEYDRIIERHLARFWEAQGAPNPAISVTPAASPAPAVARKDAAPAPTPKGKNEVTKK